MKSFWGSLLVFALMLGMIVFNHYYITRACAHMQDKTTSLPDCELAADAVSDLSEYWESKRGGFGISISKQTVEKMTLYIEELKHAASTGDAQLFERARVRILCLIYEMSDTESVRPENWV